MRILLILFLLIISCSEKAETKTEPENTVDEGKIKFSTLMEQFDDSWKITYITMFYDGPGVETAAKTQGNKKTEYIHGYFALLSSAEIKYDDYLILRKKMKDMVSDKAVKFDCFYPRHGLTLEKSERKVRILVCFECGGIKVSGHSGFFPFDGNRKLFDNIAKKYGMEVAFPKKDY